MLGPKKQDVLPKINILERKLLYCVNTYIELYFQSQRNFLI